MYAWVLETCQQITKTSSSICSLGVQPPRTSTSCVSQRFPALASLLVRLRSWHRTGEAPRGAERAGGRVVVLSRSPKNLRGPVEQVLGPDRPAVKLEVTG